MILLVNQNNHAANQAILTEMHCQRRAVFVDRLKWALTVTEGLEIETSLLFGVNQVTFVAARALLPLTLKAGWQVSPLGNAQHHGKDKITAVIADITPEGLKTVRSCHDISGPLIRFSLPPEVPASVAA